MFTRALCFCMLLAVLTLGMPAYAIPIQVSAALFDQDGDALTYSTFNVADPDANLTVSNGDFNIYRNGDPFQNEVLGDGIDDRAIGVFDFRGDSDYIGFVNTLIPSHGKIIAARMDLILAPSLSLFANDQFNLDNTQFTGAPDIGDQIAFQLANNPLGCTRDGPLLDFPTLDGNCVRVSLDLLDFYSQTQLENLLSGGSGDFFGDGRFVWNYGDDAIATFASIVLTADIPEPSTLALFSLGVLIVIRARRQHRN